MNAYGFPNLLQYHRLNGAISNLKSLSEEARIEIVTGRAADLKISLGRTIGDAQLVRKAIDDLGVFKLSATRGLGHAVATQLVLTRVADATAGLGADLISAIGRADEASIAISGARAKLNLEGAIAGFNQRYEGRSIFAGDAVDQTPLADSETLLNDIRTIYAGAADATQFEADLDFYFNDPAGGFSTSIYQGGADDAARSEISNGELVEYNAKADEQAVRDLLRSLSSIVVASDQPATANRDITLETAGTNLIEAGNGLTEIRARIGAAEERMQLGLSRLNAEEAALSEAYNEKTARDPFEAASRLQQLEAQLQASFVLSARISQLSFVNYIG